MPCHVESFSLDPTVLLFGVDVLVVLLRQDRRGSGVNNRAVAPSLLNLGRLPHPSASIWDSQGNVGLSFRPHVLVDYLWLLRIWNVPLVNVLG